MFSSATADCTHPMKRKGTAFHGDFDTRDPLAVGDVLVYHKSSGAGSDTILSCSHHEIRCHDEQRIR